MISFLCWLFSILLLLPDVELEDRTILEDHMQKLSKWTKHLVVYCDVQPPLASFGLFQVTLQFSLVLGRTSSAVGSPAAIGHLPLAAIQPHTQLRVSDEGLASGGTSPQWRKSHHPHCAARELGTGWELCPWPWMELYSFPSLFPWLFPCQFMKKSFSNRPYF